MEEGEIIRVSKNSKTDLVVRLSEFKGTKRIDIREFITEGTYTGPTKKGVNMPLNIFYSLLDKLNEAEDKIV